MAVIRKLSRIGNSSYVCLPPEIRTHLAVNKGDYLVWAVDKKGQVILDKLTPKKHPGFFLPGAGWLKRVK